MTNALEQLVVEVQALRDELAGMRLRLVGKVESELGELGERIVKRITRQVIELSSGPPQTPATGSAMDVGELAHQVADRVAQVVADRAADEVREQVEAILATAVSDDGPRAATATDTTTATAPPTAIGPERPIVANSIYLARALDHLEDVVGKPVTSGDLRRAVGSPHASEWTRVSAALHGHARVEVVGREPRHSYRMLPDGERKAQQEGDELEEKRERGGRPRSVDQLRNEAVAVLLRNPERAYTSAELRAAVHCPEPRWAVVARAVSQRQEVRVGRSDRGSMYQAAQTPTPALPVDPQGPAERARQVAALLEANGGWMRAMEIREALEITSRGKWGETIEALADIDGVKVQGNRFSRRYRWAP